MERPSDRRGQSEVIGTVLLLGLTILGASVVVGLGSTALTSTQESIDTARAEQSMTQFDSQAAQVALGDSRVQTTDLGRLDGSFRLRPGTGSITVTHINISGNESEEELYSGPLGSVIYENGGTEIAYQGGGVWRKQRNGGARMISPPEFHYRQGTLTLPVIRTEGTGAASGDVDVTTRQVADTVRKFPNASQSYTDSNRTYRNPLSEGHVTVTVESRYYEGWANYFRSRTDGNVTVNESTNEVTLKLETLGATGPFGMPNDPSDGGGSVEVRGMSDGHSVEDFRFTIYPEDDPRSAFKNLRWSMYADEGSQKFEVALKGSGDCGDSMPIYVYYSDDSHNSYQGWTGNETVECSDDIRSITVDLVDISDESDQNLTYDQIAGTNLAYFKNEVKKNNNKDPGTLPTHDASENDHPDKTYNTTETEVIDFVSAHYFAELAPNFELHVEDQQSGGSAGVDEGLSEGLIEYPGGDRVVTFLHITENRIEVDFR